MTAEKTVFHGRCENGFDAAIKKILSSFDYGFGDARPYSESSHKRQEVARARERDRDSRCGPYTLVLKNVPGFERWGRRFVRMFALDLVAEAAGAPRGGAIKVKPDPEYRNFLKDWQQVQWAREDAYTAKNDG